MKLEIKVPPMGESISEAVVGEIFKPSGSQVAEDDEILELETDKVNQVLYAPKKGVVTLSVATEDVVKIGQVIGYLEEGNGQTPSPAPAPKKEAAPEIKKEKVAKTAETLRVSKEAFVANVESKEQALPLPQPPPAQPVKVTTEGRQESRKRMPKIRQVIAKRLVEVKQQTAMLTTFNEVDMSEVIRMRKTYRDSFEKEHGVKLGFMSFFVKAAVSALKAFPDINAYIDGNEVVYREYYDIAVAVSTERGLVVPVIHDCDRLSFAQIEKTILEKAKKAREGTIDVEELQGGGFTITNGGIFGSMLSTPILNPPQSGILGMHTIKKRPMAVEDAVVVLPMMYLALSYDHRIVDGREGALFLVHVKECIEDPARLLIDF